jgi:hypothetical protein
VIDAIGSDFHAAKQCHESRFDFVMLVGSEFLQDGNCIKSAVVEWGAEHAARAAKKREAPRAQRLLMDVVEQALDECGFQFTPLLDGSVIRCVKDSVARDRYFARIAEPADGEDDEKAYERKRKAWFRSVKAALDAKTLMAASKDGERILWKP